MTTAPPKAFALLLTEVPVEPMKGLTGQLVPSKPYLCYDVNQKRWAVLYWKQFYYLHNREWAGSDWVNHPDAKRGLAATVISDWPLRRRIFELPGVDYSEGPMPYNAPWPQDKPIPPGAGV